jgi:hypothetical protein
MAQYIMLKPDMAIDRYNRVLGLASELSEAVIFNKVDEQTTQTVARVYDVKIADCRQPIIDLSNQLRGSMEAKKETTKVALAVYLNPNLKRPRNDQKTLKES